jgi:hypothetical protein
MESPLPKSRNEASRVDGEWQGGVVTALAWRPNGEPAELSPESFEFKGRSSVKHAFPVLAAALVVSSLAQASVEPTAVLQPGAALRVAVADEHAAPTAEVPTAPPADAPAAAQPAPVPVPAPAVPVEPSGPASGIERNGASIQANTGAFSLGVGLGARVSGEAVQPFAVDNAGTTLKDDPIETRLRVEGDARYARFGVVGQADFLGGAVAGVPTNSSLYLDSPHPEYANALLRKLYLEYQAPTWVFRAGQQTSQWGLGILANGGEHDVAPGEGFGDVRFGDLVYRALLAGRPFYSLGGLWRAVEPAIGADLVQHDETADYSQGDRAFQGIFALRFAADDDHWLGIYTVYRNQHAVSANAQTRKLEAFIFDAAGKWRWRNAVAGGALSLGAEAAYITGNTTLAATTQEPTANVRQFGAALKSSLKFSRWEGYFDLGYASGDQNPYGDQISGFRFNPDYVVGLVMFQEVMGWQSARSAARASDPNLSGVPPAGVQLLPSQGGVFDAAYAFPRVRWGAQEWLDIYGGPLIAFATSKLTDAYNTTAYGGGSPTNSLGGSPGNYLGTELDIGAQARAKPGGIPVTATAEAGYFVPGDAFVDANGKVMPPVIAGRMRLAIPF